MSNQIEPYSMIQKTNIKEHNDMINKINEIVDVINDANLDTINAEISGLKAKATATDTEIVDIKNKDTTQDVEINGITKNLVSNVTATFDNPTRELKISLEREASPSIDATVVIPASSETGQYSAGNGITIENYQIAVDTNVVALKTDIPVIPDISDLTQRVNTLETEMPTKASVDDVNSLETTVTNLTGTVAGKVAIAQGVENSGKVLGIGENGNVTPVSSGKKLYTGPISDFININTTDMIIEITKEFDIEFIISYTYSVRTTRVTISKGVYSGLQGPSDLSLGYSSNLGESGGTYLSVSIPNNNSSVVAGGQSTTNQITTENYTLPGTTYRAYRIYA